MKFSRAKTLLLSRSIRTLTNATSLSLSLSKTSMQAIADSIPRISEKNEDGSYTLEFVSTIGGEDTLYIGYLYHGIEMTKKLKVNITDDDNDTVMGDANCDGAVDMSDVVLIMQSLANPNKYGINGSDDSHITQKGLTNGDVDTTVKGITGGDALKIQRYLLGYENEL